MAISRLMSYVSKEIEALQKQYSNRFFVQKVYSKG